jgi:hypothetical protein
MALGCSAKPRAIIRIGLGMMVPKVREIGKTGTGQGFNRPARSLLQAGFSGTSEPFQAGSLSQEPGHR